MGKVKITLLDILVEPDIFLLKKNLKYFFLFSKISIKSKQAFTRTSNFPKDEEVRKKQYLHTFISSDNPVDQGEIILIGSSCQLLARRINISSWEILPHTWIPMLLKYIQRKVFSTQIKIAFFFLRQGIPSFLNFYNCILYLSFSYVSLTSKWCGKIVGSGSMKNRTILISPIWHISINKRCLKREALKGFHLLI